MAKSRAIILWFVPNIINFEHIRSQTDGTNVYESLCTGVSSEKKEHSELYLIYGWRDGRGLNIFAHNNIDNRGMLLLKDF